MCTGGKIGCIGFLQENPEIEKQVREACYNLSGIVQPNQDQPQTT